MAHLVPSISFVSTIKTNIAQGMSVSSALESSIQREDSDFAKQMLFWKATRERGKVYRPFKSHFQQSFLEIINSGLDGAPIYEHLCLLEAQMIQEFERQWKLYLESLPFKLSIPLLLFFFPAYIVLLFGPLIMQFLNEVPL